MIRKLAISAFALMAASAASADDLTVYSAGPKPLSAALVEAFTAKTGITVNLFQSNSGKVMARYEAEKANPQADVLISASWGHAITLSDAGELMAYTSPNSETVPGSLKTDDYVAQGAAAIAMVYNTTLDMPAPAEWSEMTPPARSAARSRAGRPAIPPRSRPTYLRDRTCHRSSRGPLEARGAAKSRRRLRRFGAARRCRSYRG